MKLFDISNKAKLQGLVNVPVNSITEDSSMVSDGDIFICVKGKNFDGHDFAEEMLVKGASAVVVERDLGLSQQIIVDNSRKYFAKLASNFYGNPTKKLKLVGITGTNGKTTITHLVKDILNSLGRKAGSIGTIGYGVGKTMYEADRTTPNPMLLYSLFSEMVKNKVEFCIMEASSQGLAQFRICDEVFEVASFTNLTQDHLDYHGTMEEYFSAKKMLFSMSKCAIINADDEYGKRLISTLSQPVLSYSTVGVGDFYSENVKIKSGGISYWLMAKGEEKAFPVAFSMPGYFNVNNSMAAIGICAKLGIDMQQAIYQLEESKGVKGRCEVIHNGDFTVICDYAHTQDALDKILRTIKSFVEGKIICLFGAAGERDAGKRKPMGETVAKLADYLVVTTDNPRNEDPHKTVDDVLEGVILYNTPYSSFVDRKKAIYYALSLAKTGDVVLLAGKGHETYQVIGNENYEFDEHKIVKEYFENL